MRTHIAAMLILTAMLLNSCGAIRRPVKPEVVQPTFSGIGWIAVEQEPNKYLIIAKGNEGTAEAMKTLCPWKTYICFDETIGEAFIIERRKK
jgi:hypothetical protein